MNIWDTQYKDGRAARQWPDEELCRFLARANLPIESRVLEVGCGNGRNAQAIMRTGLIYYGVDGSAEAIALASAEYFGGLYAHGSIPPLAYDSHSFAAVVDVQCLQHFDAVVLGETLAEIKRVIVPCGLFFSSYLIEIDAGIFPDHPELLTCQTSDYGLTVQRAGFEILRAERVTRTYESGTKQATWLMVDARVL